MKVSYSNSNKVDPDSDKGFKVRYGESRRKAYLLRWGLMILVVLLPIALYVWFVLSEMLFVKANGFLTREPFIVRAESPGRISSMLITRDQKVEVGEGLFIVNDPVLSAQKALLAQQESEVVMLNQHLRDEVNAVHQERLKEAQQNISKLKTYESKYKAAHKKGIFPLTEYVGLQMAQSAAELGYLNVKQDYARAKFDQDMGGHSARMLELQREMAVIDSKISQLSQQSPIEGVVIDVFTKQGEYVAKGQKIAMLSEGKDSVVVAYIEPRYMHYAELGQKAMVKLPDGQKIDATVNEASHLVTNVPPHLLDYFEKHEVMVKVVLTLDTQPIHGVEGLPLIVYFRQINNREPHGYYRENIVFRWLDDLVSSN